MHIFTVSEINSYLREKLEADDVLGDIWIKGEISNFKQAASGHCYFTLKENNAAIKTAMWRSYAMRLPALPVQGEAVLAHGRISYYETGGDLQLYADTLRPAGIGLLHAQFEALKIKLESEGMFDEEHKRPLPVIPRRIGIATSADGAALHDILTVLARRCPIVEVIVSPCLVQGDHASRSIVYALELLYATDVDMIILARGGGSLEDLWSFNEEIVARAVIDSPVPIVTGVGHETDTTIVDYVADVRAPTPSAAAELAVPEHDALVFAIKHFKQRMDEALTQKLDDARTRLNYSTAILQQHAPESRIALARQQVDDMVQRASTHMQNQLQLASTRLQGTSARLQTLNPLATLQRGYAMVRRAEDGTVVSNISQARVGDMLVLTLSDGNIRVEVKA